LFATLLRHFYPACPVGPADRTGVKLSFYFTGAIIPIGAKPLVVFVFYQDVMLYASQANELRFPCLLKRRNKPLYPGNC